MSDLKKCDICGRVYEGEPIGAIYQTVTSSVSIHNVQAQKHTRYDLCPLCLTRVESYISGLAEAYKNATDDENTCIRHCCPYKR